MAFSKDRIEQAYRIWRCRPFFNRTAIELRTILIGLGLREVDAIAYARDLIAAATDLVASSKGPNPYFMIAGSPETYHKAAQERWRALALKYGCPGHMLTITFIEKELEELKKLRSAQKGEGPAVAETTADTGTSVK